MKKKLLKSFLLAVTLLVGGNAWAYDVPDGYEIKNVIIGTAVMSGDDITSVTPDDFESYDELPTGWTAGELGSITLGNVTNVANVQIGSTVTNAPTYVGGKVIYGALSYGKNPGYSYITKWSSVYSFTEVTSGKIVFHADLYGNGTHPAGFRIVDNTGANILTITEGSGSGNVNFTYSVGSSAAVNIGTTKNRSYPGWSIDYVEIDLTTAKASLKIDYINNSGVRSTNEITNISLGSVSNIAGIQLGAFVGATNSSGSVNASLDNLAIYQVGLAASATTYTVVAKAGETELKTLASDAASEGDEYSVYLPRYIEYNGSYYVWNDAEDATSYKVTYTMGSTNETRTVNYTLDESIVAYVEGETTGGTNESYSNGATGSVNIGGYNNLTEGRRLGTLTAGVYKFIAKVTANESRGLAVRNNAVNNSSNNYAQTNSTGTCELEFILPETRTLNLTGRHTTGTKTNQSSDFDYAIIKRTGNLPTTEKIAVTSAGYATYVSNYNLNFTSATTKAYKVSVASKGVATLTEVSQVPAKTPVLLYKEGGNGEGENITISSSAMTAVEGNDLVAGPVANLASTDGDYKNMILNNVGGKIGFYFANGQTVAANRAYLHIASTLAPDASESRMVMVFADEEATAVFDLNDNSEMINNNWYDLQGRRVDGSRLNSGIYIKNGKKVVVK